MDEICLTGLLHAIPNDETLPVKEAVKPQKNPAEKNGAFSEKYICTVAHNAQR